MTEFESSHHAFVFYKKKILVSNMKEFKDLGVLHKYYSRVVEVCYVYKSIDQSTHFKATFHSSETVDLSEECDSWYDSVCTILLKLSVEMTWQPQEEG